MIPFYDLYLKEADDDENQDTDSADNATDAKSADDDSDNDDTSSEDNDNQEDDNEDQDNDDNKQDDSQDDNFDIDASDNTSNDDNEQDDSSSSQSSGSSTEEEVNVDNDAKKKDREIYDSLTPQQQKVKNIKLKELFMELYSKCESLIDKYNQIGTEYEYISKPIKKVLNALYNLKEMVSDYLLNLFDSNSYLENDTMFNAYLSILNSINIITKNIVKDVNKELKDDNGKK